MQSKVLDRNHVTKDGRGVVCMEIFFTQTEEVTSILRSKLNTNVNGGGDHLQIILMLYSILIFIFQICKKKDIEVSDIVIVIIL